MGRGSRARYYPQKAVADVTAVSRRKLDNVLPTMDKHGVEDIVKNLSRKTDDQRNSAEEAMNNDIYKQQRGKLFHETYGKKKK